MSVKIALAGNPNSGKTTMFNDLTGSNQRVGNWPGVTVEKDVYKRQVVDGVAPELPVLAEVVGRHAGNAGGYVFLIQQKALREMCIRDSHNSDSPADILRRPGG